MSRLQESCGEINKNSIMELNTRSETEEHLVFSLLSPCTGKAVLFFCDEDDAKLKAARHMSEFEVEGYVCAVFEKTIEEIDAVIKSLDQISAEIIIDYYFDLKAQEMVRIGGCL